MGVKAAGPPQGSQNALKHGYHRKCMKEHRYKIKALIRISGAFMANLENALSE
jgi:hypothetical protein